MIFDSDDDGLIVFFVFRFDLFQVYSLCFRFADLKELVVVIFSTPIADDDLLYQFEWMKFIPT
jgi:hypothetical protein